MSEYHEPEAELTAQIRDEHRAIASLKEELEAVDWYNQRWAASKNESLRAVLAHNRDEEIEHACMTLEWLRRNVPKWDETLRTYLFTEVPITEIEEAVDAGKASGGAPNSGYSRGDLGIGGARRPK
jgi:ferritin-like protein